MDDVFFKRRMSAEEFRRWQAEMNLDNLQMAGYLGVGLSTVGLYRNGRSPIPVIYMKYLRMSRYAKQLRERIQELEAQLDLLS